MLANGESSTVTYTFTYRATGNRVLDNSACLPAPEAQDPAAACDTVSVPGSGLVHRKSVDPASGTPVEVGDTLTYTLTFDNTAGPAAATVDTTDDLSAVLDDATFVDGSITEGAGLTRPVPATRLAVTGTRAGRGDPDGDLPGHGAAVRRAGRPRPHQRARLRAR